MTKFLQGLNWISILGVVIAIEIQLGNGSMSIAHSFPATWIPAIREWAANLASVGLIIMSTGAHGRMPSVSASSVAPIAKMILLPLALAMFLASGGIAHAAPKREKLKAPVFTGDVQKDFQHNFGFNQGPGINQGPIKLTGNPDKDLMALWQKIVSASNTDLTYASALAGAANTASSKIRKQCWDAIIALNQQANGQNLKNPDGTPMTKPDPHVFTDVETLAEVVDNLSPQGPLFTACAGAAELAKTNTLAFINAVVTGAAGIAALPAGL